MTTPIGTALPPPDYDTESGFGIGPKIQNWLSNSVYPILRNVLAIANESNTTTELVHTAITYSWDMNAIGTLFINQTAGATLEMSVDASVVLAKLRRGRRYVLVVYNTTGGVLPVSFSSDFVVAGIAIGNNFIAAWEFVVKDEAFGPSGTIIEITA